MSTNAQEDAELALAQLARLSVLTEALARARTPEELATIVVESGKAALGAEVSSFVRVEGDELVRLAVRGLPLEYAKAFERFPIALEAPSPTAARTGKPLWIESAAHYRAEFPLAPYSVASPQAACAIPLVLDERVTGVLLFVFATERTFSGTERAFMETFARQTAIALERTDSHVRELDYQRRLEALAAAERHARREADLANRTKDEFLATVSHELRTPLNAIMGWARMLMTSELEPDKVTRAVETIDRNASAMAQLVEDLLDISRIISGKMRLEVQRVAIDGAIDAAIESMKPALDAKGIRLQAERDPEIGHVMGDPARLQQIFWNLFSNAVKFTPAGGSIGVRMRRTAKGTEVVVTDSGNGIAADFLPYVFEPFRQEDASHTRKRGGLGLGLAITRQLVELHGGTIAAESPGHGHGATFTVTLPTATG